MKSTHSAGGVVIQKTTHKVLIVEQANKTWSLPKGHLDQGEDTLQAAIREIREESGVKTLKLLWELGSYERYKIAKGGGDDTSEVKKITMYLFETEQMDLCPEDKDNPSALWLDKEEIISRLSHPKDIAFYKSVLEQYL